MESGTDKKEENWATEKELDRKIEELKEDREREKEEKLEKLIIQIIVSSTLKEYYEKSDKIPKI
ncbi:hypothetical protein J2786_000503 [Chryseobacterium vietnamense]|uniref:Uncharacterized protein n=1 Tax=Chryseobacterium vietnamense TaxID=866785 RepID=A0ACC6J3G7_9FLAO|nr:MULTISPECIES: hypothetical protein [Chryseobacterium]MDR6457410.1 hypothetical protein [Chryseobacterium vietnamense]